MSEEWGEWQIHDGDGCPCVGQVVHIVIGNTWDGVDPDTDSCTEGWTRLIEEISPREAIVIAESDGSWTWHENFFPVIRYRIRRPFGMKRMDHILEQVRDDHERYTDA